MGPVEPARIDGAPASGVPVVFVVEDDPAIVQSLQWLVETVHLRLEAYGTGQAFLDACDLSRAGCAILDVRLPGMSGLDVQARMVALGVRMPIIFVSAHADVPTVVRAVKGGAFDFIEKPFNGQHLLDRIHAAIALDGRLRAEASERDAFLARARGLTSRQRQVLELVVAGLSNKSIGVALELSVKTVEAHRGAMMEKLQAGSVARLLQLYARHLAPPE